MAKILLIDDNFEMQKMLQLALKRKAGHEVTLAEDGRSGLEMALRGSFDVILLDIMMPDLDGYEVARRLRADPHTQRTPIIFITARMHELDKSALAKAEVNGYISKLTSTEEIAAKISDVLVAARSKGNVKSTAPLPAIEGRSLAVLGCRGGVGATTLAVNLAALLTRKQKHVCLVELTPLSGHAAMMLHLPSGPSWGDLGEDTSMQAIGQLLIRHSSGLQLLAAPQYPPNLEFTIEKFAGVAHTVATLFEEVIVNCAPSITSTTRATLNRADRILLVLSPEITAVQTAITSLKFLRQTLNISYNRLRIVLNHPTPNLSLPPAQIEKALGHSIDATLPFEAMHMSALAQGIPLGFGATSGLPYLLGLRELMQKL